MDVRSVIDEIQRRVERENTVSGASFTPSFASSADDSRLVSMRAAYERLYAARDLVGQMPPSPETLRATIGKSLVRTVQRMLFWYTPQILQFQREAAKFMGGACDLIQRQFELIGTLQNDVRALRSERSTPAELPRRTPVPIPVPIPGARTTTPFRNRSNSLCRTTFGVRSRTRRARFKSGWRRSPRRVRRLRRRLRDG